MKEDTYNLISVILAIASVVQPMFFGLIFLFMFRLFPTRREIELQESNQKARHEENQARFAAMENDIKTILRDHE